MKQIRVLGTGCANCKTTIKLIEEQAKAKGADIQLEKVEDIAEIMGYGVMSTPGVVIDGTVVHAGGIPSKATIDGWLESDSSEAPADAGSGSGGCCCG